MLCLSHSFIQIVGAGGLAMDANVAARQTAGRNRLLLHGLELKPDGLAGDARPCLVRRGKVPDNILYMHPLDQYPTFIML